jgi:LmbE family N-acetylglucosaminyl deacetylase
MALLARMGADVHVCYVTDGEATVGSLGRGGEVAQARRAEGRAACEILGARSPRFLGLPDGSLDRHGASLTAAIREVIDDIRPDVVLAPWEFDGHPDHRAVHGAVPADVLLWGYEVWTPLLPTWVVDITSVLDVKRNALDVFTTATGAFDPTAMLGLNRYRSLVAQAGEGYAEAFAVRPATEADRASD